MGSNADPLIDGGTPSASANRPKKTTCEFCSCELGLSGQYVELSGRAKKLRALEDMNEKLEAEISSLRKEFEEYKQKNATPQVAERQPYKGLGS